MAMPNLATEDWKKDYDKIILARKFASAAARVADAFALPVDVMVKNAYAGVSDCVSFMPIGIDVNNQKRRDELLARLDEIEVVLYGDPDGKTMGDLYRKYGVSSVPVRSGVKMVPTIQNLPSLVKHLRNILVDAGDFSTAIGLRVTLPKQKKYGLDRILEEEGINPEELDIFE